MKKSVVLGVLILGAAGYAAASCASNDNKSSSTLMPTGGQSSNAGSSAGGSHAGTTSTGGSSAGSSGDSGPPFACGHADASAEFSQEGGLVRVGYTDPARSVTLGDGGYYAMPGGNYKGYCFTYTDKAGSYLYPPCGQDADGGYLPCFTLSTGMCLSASLGSGSATTWGGGFGCNLNQGTASGAAALNTNVQNMQSITIGVYGCAIPSELQLQLNVSNPPSNDAGTPGSGYFCYRTALGAADASGVRSATFDFTKLVQDCWVTNDAGQQTGPVFDPATMNVKSIQVQVNALDGKASNWDFCVSQLSIQ
jgi:hypothetical protein